MLTSIIFWNDEKVLIPNSNTISLQKKLILILVLNSGLPPNGLSSSSKRD